MAIKQSFAVQVGFLRHSVSTHANRKGAQDRATDLKEYNSVFALSSQVDH